MNYSRKVGRRKMRLSYEAFVEENKDIWFSAFDHNGLYHLDTSSGNISFLGRFPGEAMYQIRLYTSVVKYNDCLFFIPFNAYEMAIYHIATKQFHKIGIDFSSYENEKFWCHAVYKNKLFLLPHCYPAIIIFNMETYEVKYEDSFLEKLIPFKLNEEPYTADCIVENTIAYCSCACANIIIRIDLETDEVSLISIPFSGTGYHGILKDGELFWLAPRLNGGIVKYNSNLNKIWEFNKYPSEFDFSIIPFHTFYKFENKLFLAPAFSNLFIEINKETGEMYDMPELSVLLKGERMNFSYSIDTTMACSLEKNIFSFFIGGNYEKIFFDLYTKEMRSYVICVEETYSDEEQSWMRNIILQDIKFFEEDNETRLNEYLRLLQSNGFRKKNIFLKEYTVGNEIFKYVMGN